MLTRYDDVTNEGPPPGERPAVTLDAVQRFELPRLPKVDWGALGRPAPEVVTVDYQGPDAPLPAADAVVLTWTSAEWAALDHVLVAGDPDHTRTGPEMEQSWHLYGADTSGFQTDNVPARLWGYYQVVRIGGAKVLLFKCDAHLAHPPWIKGLVEMLELILRDTEPSWIYSIGTAGGTRDDVRLGDVTVTNAAHIELKNDNNSDVPIANQSFSSAGPFPATALFDSIVRGFYPLTDVVTTDTLESAVARLHTEVPESAPFTLADLLNGALDPANLASSRVLAMQGTPLLTTDFYYIAGGPDDAQWAVLEMDDAVIAYVAGRHGVDYAFVRNVSDPLVPTTTAAGAAIPASVRDGWSGMIYERFGLYSSFNGALATWAAIAGGS